MNVSDFDYELPGRLIAQTPLDERDASRLMVLRRSTGTVEHRNFRDLPSLLRPKDLLVLNDTRVLPARLLGRRNSGGQAEILLLHPTTSTSAFADGARWKALARPARRLHEGERLDFTGGLVVTILRKYGAGEVEVELRGKMPGGWRDALQETGSVPLPPYIHGPLGDPERYQTVYGRKEGSAAAPTAGLHFTGAMFERLEEHGIATSQVTLHVGLGTFRPVSAERVEEHDMHGEWCEVSQETVDAIRAARRAGGRVVAVGTTACRTLEGRAGEDGMPIAGSGWTDIFMYPGYRFRVTDVLLTNFHLPKSTLLMLVSALAGREFVLEAYREAVREEYRFYSFGDAMLILP